MSKRCLGIFALLAMTLTACNGNRLNLAAVTGTITYKGAPLADANVSFLPEVKGMQTGLGKTDKEGRFSLSTLEPGDGCPVGWCKVAVSKLGPPKKLPAHFGEAMREQLADTGDPLIPQKYFDPDKSGLRFEIKSGKNDFKIELE